MDTQNQTWKSKMDFSLSVKFLVTVNMTGWIVLSNMKSAYASSYIRRILIYLATLRDILNNGKSLLV